MGLRHDKTLLSGVCWLIFPMMIFASEVASAASEDESFDAPEVPKSVWLDNSRVRSVLAPTTDFTRAEKFESMQGGAGTTSKTGDKNALSHHTRTLDLTGLQRFKLGNALFNKLWVSSPSSTHASDGLGPFFNARACQSCHIKDGRGNLPQIHDNPISVVLQLKRKAQQGWLADPVYGKQIQTVAVPGVTAEARVTMNRTAVESDVSVPSAQLTQVSFELSELAYDALHPGTVLSPRIAPAMTGLGLLEAIDDNFLLAYADPFDEDGDGISGRPNWDILPDGRRVLGRFGHKAAKSSVLRQTAGAFSTDMGLSSPVFVNPQGDCTAEQIICDSLAHGVQRHLGEGEVSQEILDLVSFYSSHLAVPERRHVSDENVLTGKRIFYESGCIRCHTPKHVTSREAGVAEHRFQLIWPYTDLLLHDMGEALADGAGDGMASGREWRTPPLWGIGVAKQVNPNASFLHDGRAETVMEAILWHGGEALASRQRIERLRDNEKHALIEFIESL